MTTWTEPPAWEERYGGTTAVWSGHPNRWLVHEASGLAPGTALDAGCGEGGDALWLAAHGWRVTAVDFAAAGLARAAAADPDGQVQWVRADLRSWIPPASYDLVSVQFLHPAADVRAAVLARLAAAVAPGGTLLVVGHNVAGMGGHHPDGMYPGAAELAAELDPAGWEIVAEDRQRPATGHETDHGTTLTDAVLVARRR
ncbi:MAG TPA: methyltransferase domain-containing protein [Mycobacteriales bacterium]|nr:methyltransferase domain-containing protein [Mycobacteriales bacterium]